MLVVSTEITAVWSAFVRSFDASVFRNDRDRSRISDVIEAVASVRFHVQLQHVHWVCDRICHIQRWGTGCDCHEHLILSRGVGVVDCIHKGRRLKKAFPYAMAQLNAMLQECNSWSEHDFLGFLDIWQSAQGSMRGAFWYSRAKIDFLDNVPWLFVRLHEVGVKEKIMQQWSAAPMAHHHRMTQHVLDPGGNLRVHFDVFEPPALAHPDLERIVERLSHIPMDDAVAEGPHAIASHIMQIARGCSWAWVASTMRVHDNLCDSRELLVEPTLLQTTWDTTGSLLKTVSDRNMSRPRRMPRKQLIHQIYHPTQLIDVACDEAPVDAGGAGVGGGGGGAGGGDYRPEDEDGGSDGHGGGGGSDRDGHGDDGGPSGPSGSGSRAGGKSMSDEEKLMREFLAASLQPFMYFSAPSGEAHNDFVIYQVLHVELRGIFVPTWKQQVSRGHHVCIYCFVCLFTPFLSLCFELVS